MLDAIRIREQKDEFSICAALIRRRDCRKWGEKAWKLIAKGGSDISLVDIRLQYRVITGLDLSW